MPPPATGNRRRPGHRACQVCNGLKLRCVRDRSDLPCNRCLVEGRECAEPERRSRKSRTGSRVVLARTLFGESSTTSLGRTSSPSSEEFVPTEVDGAEEDQPFVPSSEAYEPASTSYDAASPPSWDEPDILSPSSTDCSLSVAEVSHELSSRLIEEYFVATEYPAPVSRWKDFLSHFEKAGRRVEQLQPPIAQALAAVLVARGARVTSAPCVVGNDAAAYDMLTGDLSEFGMRRAAACAILDKRAVRLADECGTFRAESTDSIAVLMMLSTYLDHDDPSRRKGRPYRVAAAGHARSIVEDKRSGTDLFIPLKWMIYIHDTWNAASAGRTPNLGETDEQLVCSFTKSALPTIEDLLSSLDSVQTVLLPAGMMWAFVTRLTRHVDRHLRRGPRARQTFAVIQEAYMQLDEYMERFRTLWPVLNHFIVAGRPGLSILRRFFVSAPFPNILLTFYIHRAIKKWMNTSTIYESLELETKVVLDNLRDESNRRMDRCARDLAQLLRRLSIMAPSRTALTFMPAIGLIYETLPMWASQLCSLQTNEDGSPTGYTREEKTKEMSWFLDAVHSLGWAYADKTLEDAMATLELCLSQYEVHPKSGG